MVVIRLHDKENLWSRFHAMKNEMIVTKTGRKMFPKLEFTVEELDPEQYYGIVINMEQVDEHRYKFQEGEWCPAGRGEMSVASSSVAHHDGVMTGAQWMRNPIHFERLKITNNPADSNPSHIFLHSMHKYIPVITVFQVQQTLQTAFLTPGQIPVVKEKFPETEFVTVTAYQNEKTKSLKIRFNPYAKGFREGGDRKRATPPRSPADSSPVEKKPFEMSTQLLASPLTISPVNPFLYPGLWNPYLFSPFRLQSLQALQKPFPM